METPANFIDARRLFGHAAAAAAAVPENAFVFWHIDRRCMNCKREALPYSVYVQ